MSVGGNHRRIVATTVSLTAEQNAYVEEIRARAQISKAAAVRLLIEQGMPKPNPAQMQQEVVNNIYVNLQRTIVLFYRWMEQELAREDFSTKSVIDMPTRFAEMSGIPTEILSAGKRGYRTTNDAAAIAKSKEDAEDHAAADANKDKPSRPWDEVKRELGLTEEKK